MPPAARSSVCRAATELARDRLRAIGCVVSAGEQWSPRRQDIHGVLHHGGGAPTPGIHAELGRRSWGQLATPGVGLPSGEAPPRHDQVAGERLRKAGVRKDRAKHLNIDLKGTVRLLRTGVVPCATHGARITGMTTGMIRSLDSLASGMLGGKRGRSTHVRLSLAGELPSCRPAIAPMVASVEACL